MAQRKDDASKAVSQARRQANEIKKKAQKLLRNAQLDVREYRKELSELKKQGIVSKVIDARTHKPTRYMLSKINRYKDVATGKALAVEAARIPSERRNKYLQKGTAKQVDKFLVVPKTAAKQKLDVVKGHLATYTKLAAGEERVIYLPFEAKNLNDVVRQLEDHESEINQLKEPKEQFGFQLFGHNAKRGFPDADELFRYLTLHYSHLLSDPRKAAQAFNHFVLIRFRNKKGMPELEPQTGPKRYGRKKNERRDSWYDAELRKRATLRKQKQRAKENAEQREERLEKQRNYDRQRANVRREARMGKRLLGDL